ncbi:MAG: MFS transporter [Candidatus Hydrogenedentes bacterium]|nr:MFS transporter [Candidatus Hydrogenedentota bacterium]
MARKGFFYGWILLAVAWVCYGFGISPAYYTWGAFASSIIEDLEFSRADIGGVFGLFTFLYSGVGPLVGLSMARLGIRATMSGGFVASALGLFLMSRADSLLDCYIAFALLGGSGIGFATIIPCQTLGQNWFLKRRALAIAIIFTAGGIVGKIVTRYDAYMLEHYDWRTGWLVLAGVSGCLAILAALLIRDTPEQLGQMRDGASPDDESAEPGTALASADSMDTWTAKQALRTWQFGLLVICGIAYAVPWGVTVTHMTLHFMDIGFTREDAIPLLGTMALISIAGRMTGMLGDYVSPTVVLAVALAVEGLGCGGLLIAETKPMAYLCIAMIGLGFGTAYISIPVVFSNFFGRQAFGMTSGVRILITGVFNAAGPWLAGMIFDSVGSYRIPFITLTVLGIVGAISASFLRHPGSPSVHSVPGDGK